MTTGRDTPKLCETDRDFLELLLCKIITMKTTGNSYFARKMRADEILYNQAKKDLNEYLIILKRRGYDGSRFIPKPKQGSLI